MSGMLQIFSRETGRIGKSFSNSTNGKKWNLKKFKTKETPFSEDCELQSIERVDFAFIWKESLKEFSDELKY